MGILKRLQTDRRLNPWLDVADRWLSQLQTGPIRFWNCLVESEKIKVEKYNELLRKNSYFGDKYKLILEMPPCPCVGHPAAPIWFMLKNPGCSAWDWYDIYSVSAGKKQIKTDDKRCRARIRRFDEIDQREALRRRQELVVRQLKFDFDAGSRFYSLENEFRTYDGGARVVCGAFDWYDSNLFPRNGFLTKWLKDGSHSSKLSFCKCNIFVLDYHPYRTKECCEAGIDLLQTSYWKELVQYAFKKQKMMIFWGSKILERVRTVFPAEYKDAANHGRIIVLHSPSACCSMKSANRPVVSAAFLHDLIKAY